MMQSNQPYQNADQGVSWGSIGGLAAVVGAGYLGIKHRKKIGGYLNKGKAAITGKASSAPAAASGTRTSGAIPIGREEFIKSSGLNGDAVEAMRQQVRASIQNAGGAVKPEAAAAATGQKVSSSGRVLR